ARGRGESGRAHVLNADDVAAADQLEGRLEQQLLRERVPDLHLRPPGFAAFLQLFARERRAVDPVPSGARAHHHDRVARAGRLRADQVLGAHEADGHRVDERVALVRVLEVDLAPDVGDADTVGVVADPLHHAGEEVPYTRAVQGAEAERVEHRDGAGAHGEDVPQDAAHARGRTLVRLDGRRVVVRLDLERHGVAVAQIDDAGVLA